MPAAGMSSLAARGTPGARVGRLGLGACQVVFCEACSDSQVNRACGTHPADAVLWDRPCVLKYIQCCRSWLVFLDFPKTVPEASGCAKEHEHGMTWLSGMHARSLIMCTVRSHGLLAAARSCEFPCPPCASLNQICVGTTHPILQTHHGYPACWREVGCPSFCLAGVLRECGPFRCRPQVSLHVLC